MKDILLGILAILLAMNVFLPFLSETMFIALGSAGVLAYSTTCFILMTVISSHVSKPSSHITDTKK